MSLSYKKCYFHQPGTTPLIYRNIGQQLDLSAKEFPNVEAVVACSEGKRLTYTELNTQVSKLGAGFLKLGLKPGDALGIWAPNYLHWYISMLAAARIGLVTVGINPNFQASELKYALNKVKVKALVASENYRNTNYYEIIKEVIPEVKHCKPGEIESKEVPSLKYLIIDSTTNYSGAFKFNEILESSGLLEIEGVQIVQNSISPDSPCNIQFTSGTTGLPKAAVLTHFGILNSALHYKRKLNINEAKICGILPLFHVYALVVGKLSCITAGSTYVIPSPYFNAEIALDIISEEKCTHIQGTPTMYVDLIETQKRLNISIESLKYAVTGGASCSPQFIYDIKHILKVENVQNAFGISETSANVFLTKINDSDENLVETVGVLNEHLEAKIINEVGETVRFGELGELCIRGFNIMLEYFDDKEKTMDVLDEHNWYKTGDQFILREDGYGVLAGRLKEMIIRGGENIFPKEIEDFLNTHPDIVESHVIGVADARMGEELCAFVRLKVGSELNIDLLRKFCKGKIANFKIPKHLRFVEAFPKTTSGKIQKYKLKEMFDC